MENPDATFTISAEYRKVIHNGNLDCVQAYMSDKLKIQGYVTLLIQLEDMIAKPIFCGQEG